MDVDRSSKVNECGLMVSRFALAPNTIAAVLLVMVMNASGAVGDLWMVLLELRQTADALVCDTGDDVKIYAPQR